MIGAVSDIILYQPREFFLAVAQWFWLGDTGCPDSGPQGEHSAELGRHLAATFL